MTQLTMAEVKSTYGVGIERMYNPCDSCPFPITCHVLQSCTRIESSKKVTTVSFVNLLMENDYVDI